jgi:gastric intrinsic factor
VKSLKVGKSKYTYSFEATEWPNGHYVHTIAGHKEEPSHYHYWLLYQVPTLPDPTSPPGNNLITPVGQ